MKNKEYNWLLSQTNIVAKYRGEYIAIVSNSVVAHGKDLEQVLKIAEKNGKEPYIYKVPSTDKPLIVCLNAHSKK